MHQCRTNRLGLLSISAAGLLLWGCATATPVRHLSSDVCLIMPESTTKTEVVAFLGEPDHKTNTDGALETWVYYKKNEDLLRKIPLLGERFGSLNYEMVTVSFSGNLVRTCVYRQLAHQELLEQPTASQIISPE